MEVYRDIGALREYVAGRKRRGNTVVFVPTMGALHDGHGACVRRGREVGNAALVVSIFVNPTQFGPGEDLDRYPRTLDADLDRCRRWGVDAVFVPNAEDVYPPARPGPVWVTVEKLTEPMCGASRPGHFRGVTTVVAKLFNIVRPDVAVFGQKDAQQALVIREMARQLLMPVEIVAAPVRREADGLAKSSRNRYLSNTGRRTAAAIHRSLAVALERVRSGERNPAAIEAAVRADLEGTGGIEVEYVELRAADDLSTLESVGGKVILAVAAVVESTRLIDNVVFSVAADGGVSETSIF